MRILSRESFLFLLLVFSSYSQEAFRPSSLKSPSLAECLQAHAICDEVRPCLRCRSSGPLCRGYHNALAAASLGQCQALVQLCTPGLSRLSCETRVPHLPFQAKTPPLNSWGHEFARRGGNSVPPILSTIKTPPEQLPNVPETSSAIVYSPPLIPSTDPSSSSPTPHSISSTTSYALEEDNEGTLSPSALPSEFLSIYHKWKDWILPLAFLGIFLLSAFLAAMAAILCECRARKMSRVVQSNSDTVRALTISIQQGSQTSGTNPAQQGSASPRSRGAPEYNDDRLADLNPEYEEVQPFPGTEQSSSFKRQGMSHLYLSSSPTHPLHPPSGWQLRSTGLSTLPTEHPKLLSPSSDLAARDPEWPEPRPQVASLSLRPPTTRF